MAVLTVMKSRVLYFTHPNFDFSSVNKTSSLLTGKDQILNGDEYHTSLGDLDTSEILTLLPQFAKVVFIKEGFDPSDTLYRSTVRFLNYIQSFKQIENFIPTTPTSFIDHPELSTRADTPTLWVFGCSHSYGVGLRPTESKYSEIVARELDLPLKLIAKSGSSLHWSLRHLINANLQVNDLVIWQLAPPGRLSQYNGHTVNEIAVGHSNNQHLLEVNNEDQIYFDHLTLLNFGVNYLRAKGIKFRFLTFGDFLNNEYQEEYFKYPEYCYAPGFNVDLGTDNKHCGPLSNKILAKVVLDHIQCKNVYTI